MKRKRFTEGQIISILEEHEAGAGVPDLARRDGVAENSVYRWKSKYGGIEVSGRNQRRSLDFVADQWSRASARRLSGVKRMYMGTSINHDIQTFPDVTH